MARENDFIKGTCKNMCPEKEIKIREKEGLLHKLEILGGSEQARYPKADPKKIVKKYSRCAAGQPMPKQSDLRTPEALKNTVNYLMEEVVTLENFSWCVIYDFMFDRLCAVRQDAVIQDLNIVHSIDILKPIVRFLAYSGYRMCEESIQKFDPAINVHHLTECLRKLLSLYDKYECQNEGTENNYSICSCERSQFEALYLIIYLGNAEAINRALNLKQKLRTPIVNLALKMSFAYFGGNYIRVCRMFKNLPPLLLCAAALHLPITRRCALLVMSVAFSSRSLQYPASSLKTELLFENEDVVINECKHYGIAVQDKSILFQKGVFNEHVSLISPHHHAFINKALQNCYLPDIFTRYNHQCQQST